MSPITSISESNLLDSSSNTTGLRQRKRRVAKAERISTNESLWTEEDSDAEPPSIDDSAVSFESEVECLETVKAVNESFFAFRLQYLIVHIAIMLADGMQGELQFLP